MKNQGNETVWYEIATLINALPPDERQHYRREVRRWVHDLGHYVGLIRTSEGLLRREAMSGQAADKDLLDIVRDAAVRLVEMLPEIRELGEAIDNDDSN